MCPKLSDFSGFRELRKKGGICRREIKKIKAFTVHHTGSTNNIHFFAHFAHFAFFAKSLLFGILL